MRTFTRRGRRVQGAGKLPFVKMVNPKRGGVYLYFDTGQVKADGKPIYKKLPDMADPSFGATYASFVAGRTRRESVAPALMLKDLITLYRRSPKFMALKPSSRDTYDLYLDNLDDAFNNAEAAAIERRDMVFLIDSMADRPAAANMQLRVTSAFFAWARKRGHLTTRPCDDIDQFEIGEHDPWPVDLLEQALIADDPLVKLAVHLLYFTGQRIGDVCALRWSNYRDGRIVLSQEKTDKEASFHPHPDLAALLDATPRKAMTILENGGRPVRSKWLRDQLQAWASVQGHSIVPHGLRKNAVNALLEAGCSEAETAAITQQSLEVVRHYAKKRDTRKLADAAILKWGGNRSGTGKQ